MWVYQAITILFFSDLFRKVGLSNVDIMFAPHRIAVFKVFGEEP